MGLPIIGETLQFFVPYTSTDISPFIKKRIQRYGPVFRTSIVGHPIIVSTDPELNSLVFKQGADSWFKPWYTDSFSEIIGSESLMFHEGFLHKYVRGLVREGFGPDSLKSLLVDLEGRTKSHLGSWSVLPSVDLKEVVSAMLHGFAVEKLYSFSDPEMIRGHKQSYDAFLRGLISFPLNIPGTAYWKCLQVWLHKDLMEEIDSGESPLTEKMATDLLFLLPFAAFESTSSTIVSAFHYLTAHPAALAELTREHEAILKRREESGSVGISWREYKSMTFTHMVTNETLRLTNIVPGIFRKVMKDVEVKGYLIPAGWTVMVYPTAAHLNPSVYDDPLSFNPWRWEGQKVNSGSENFMAFGGGTRFCSGAEFVKLCMAIFFHHLVTKYRYVQFD
ncbi:unnamed protein product [Linum tenue]|uniref:Cytochrome P450 n=1 Tax=Linum tenue TaxID=586396 RepID=A0AAV0J2E8_9ROSI|nr:unnamed protein product [Linum tenue]